MGSSNTAAPAAPAAAAKPKFKRLKWVSRLTDGARGFVEIVAVETKTGGFRSYAKHRVKLASGKTDTDASQGRGLQESHTSFDAAKTAAMAKRDEFTKLGWSLKPGVAIRSSFDLSSLPKPGTAPAPAAKPAAGGKK